MDSGYGRGWGQDKPGFNPNQSNKRPLEDDSSQQKGKKNPLEVMQMVIKNSQKDIQNKTSSGLPQDPEALKQIFTRQQMLLELQTEMMAQMSNLDSNEPPPPQQAQPKPKKEPQSLLDLANLTSYPMPGRNKMPNEDFYYGFNVPGKMKVEQGGRESRRFNEMGRNNDQPRRNRSRGPDDFDPPLGRVDPGGMDRFGPPGGLDRYGPPGGRGGFGPDDFGPPVGRRGFGPEDFGPDDFGPPSRMGAFGAFDDFGPGDDFGPRDDFGRGGYGPRGGRGFGPPGDIDDFGPMEGRGGNDSRRGKRGRPGLFANSNPLNRPYNTLPVEDRLTIVKRDIFKYDNFPQALRVLETARHNCPEAHIRTTYEDEPLDGDRFQGFLIMNGVLVGVEEGRNKIDAKVNCYCAALYILLTKPLSYIFAHSVELYDKRSHPTKMKREVSLCDERFNWIVESLCHGVRALPTDCMNRDFEEVIYSLELSITHIYKQTKTGYSCEFYVDDLFVSQAEAIRKADSYAEAVKVARMKLSQKPSKIRARFNHLNRLRHIDFHAEDIIDIRFAENKHRVYSNLEELKKRGVSSKSLREVKDRIVVIVPTGATSTWNLLEETALANKVLMEFVENGLGNVKRCVIYMQGQIVADSYSSKQESGKSVAMRRAKQVLMKRHRIGVEVAPIDYEKVALTFEQIVEKAGELSMTEPKYLDGKEAPNYGKPEKNEPEPNELSPWVDAFLRIVINSYKETEGLDDMIVSHLPSYHSQLLLDQADELGVVVTTSRHKNVAYIIIQKYITKDLSAQKFLDYVSAFNDKTSGRYKVVEFELDLHKKDN
ncbi:uncharacterized protein LOC126821456 isoform X2 [Patella vulgata]|uniref:uncharacterized protein LOC126821456 isoform X2 n=1 Tax=Patella vulgata TaxID=6465 RepID=UPI00217FF06F|nr:uncharacterized protein LOC126821456 isoform X2 [Patella vulgata]